MVAAWLLPALLLMFLFSSPPCVAALACCWDREQWRRVSWKPWMGQVKHSWASSQVPQRLLHWVGSHCLRHLIVLNSIGGVCIALIYSKLVTGARKGRSLGLDMPPTPRGRNCCLSEAILERYFRCGFRDGDNFSLVEAIPEMWQHLVAPTPPQPHAPGTAPALCQLTCCLACLSHAGQENVGVTDKPVLLIMSILVWILAGRQWVGWWVERCLAKN